MLHIPQKCLVIEILDGSHAGGLGGTDVLVAIVNEEDRCRCNAKALSGMRIDGGIRLCRQQPVRKSMVRKVCKPGAAVENTGFHGIAEVRQDARAHAGGLQARRPVDHGLIRLRPEGDVGRKQAGELLRCELAAKIVRHMTPIGAASEHTAVVVMAIAPVRLVKVRVLGAENGLHLGPGGGVGRTGKDEAIVEEHGFDRKSLLMGGHVALWEQREAVVSKGQPCRAVYAERMRFSERTAWEPGVNSWAEAAETLRADGRPFFDLTMSNPTACGLGPRSVNVLMPLAAAEALRYVPDPFGMEVARSAVATYYSDHGAHVSPRRICLTTSTSEAYSFLFRLLCDPGDEVLIARPSYPLFDLLARLDDVVLREYSLFYEAGAHGGWGIDFDGLTQAIGKRTRAVIVVHPNNPTGNFVRREDREHLENICAQRGLALIVDEVFLDYGFAAEAEGQGDRSTFAAGTNCLAFVLSGISKICALPQMKASWIAVTGPEAEVQEAVRRLEIIADTFLSMNAPVQHALGPWLAGRSTVQEAIQQRLRENLRGLDHRLKGSMGDRLHVEGGWTVVLRVPRFVKGEAFAFAAMRHGVLVQPGTFYGLPEGRCVLSLLTEPSLWQEGLDRLPLRL